MRCSAQIRHAALLLVILAASACRTLDAVPPGGAGPFSGAADAQPATPPETEKEAPASPAESVVSAASPDPEFDLDLDLELEVDDPFEASNRRVFAANQFLDRWILNPVARGYGRITPDAVERRLRCFFANLDEPPVIVNDLLQLEGRRAAIATGRLLINTTLGVGGLWDPARRFGLKRHESDFGQTLGKAHVPPGPYLVLPVAGPSNPRDLIGSLVDLALHAEDWFLPLRASLGVGALDAVSKKEQFRPELEQLERTAIDFYAAVRAGYTMLRREKVQARADRKN